MTKLLFVTGDDDYSALTFQQSFDNQKMKDLWVQAWEYKKHSFRFIKEEEWDLTAYQFDEIDPNFISFLKDKILDYDMSKHANFFLIDDVKDKK